MREAEGEDIAMLLIEYLIFYNISMAGIPPEI
jgi:hypothetical protein